jgi:hypothetical protein
MGGALECAGEEDVVGRWILAERRGRTNLREDVFEHPFQERSPERAGGSPRGIRPQERIHRGDLPADVDGHSSGSLSPRSVPSIGERGVVAAPLG